MDGKSNEITAVPKLLEFLELQGAVVTLDAMHCQTETARSIQDRGADYVLTVKGNQPTLHQRLEELFLDYGETIVARPLRTATLLVTPFNRLVGMSFGRLRA